MGVEWVSTGRRMGVEWESNASRRAFAHSAAKTEPMGVVEGEEPRRSRTRERDECRKARGPREMLEVMTYLGVRQPAEKKNFEIQLTTLFALTL